MECDILVIGGGPGGYVAAIRAAQLGASTVLVEKNQVGGTCLNRGCIPTKTLLHASKIASEMKNAEKFGFKNVKFEIDFNSMQRKKGEVIQQLRSGIESLLRKNGIKVLMGEAFFKSAHEVRVESGNGKENIYAKHIIIATGSLPLALNLPGAANLTENSDEVLEWNSVPEELVIVGGGYIGIEFAILFSNLGSNVTVLEMMPNLLAQMDTEIVSALSRELIKKGIIVNTTTKLLSITKKGSKEYALVEQDGITREIHADAFIQAVGRVPNIEYLRLENTGIVFDGKGIKVDESFMTNVSGIYAIGDVIGGIQLAHLASAQGIKTVEQIMGIRSHHNLNIVPFCLFSEPEIASVGLTEEQTKARNVDYVASRFPLRFSGRAMSSGETEGMVKIISEKKYGEILGVHIIAPRATDLIAEACLAIRLEATVEELATTIHAHPTFSESIMEAASIALGNPMRYVE